MSEENKGMTEIQKNMVAELLESGKCTSKFETGFMETMTKNIEKGWSISFKQNDILEGMYDKQILGNNQQRTEYKFEYVTVVKNDTANVWQVFINGIAYGDEVPKGDALSAALWLSKYLKTIAIDWGMAPEQRQAIEDWGDSPSETTPAKEEVPSAGDDVNCPF